MIPRQKRTLGINFNQNQDAEISVWAPRKNSIGIQCHDQIIPLIKDDFGYWTGKTSEIKPGDLYKIQIDADKTYPDPCSLSQPEGVHGRSMALDLNAFSWQDGNWQNLPMHDYILYELHIGTFTNEGTLLVLEQKLDYLIELGITAIELMPITQFPGNRNWGYDGVFPFAVHAAYGGAHKLQNFVNRCHKKGLAVVLDVVYNHLGPEGNYLNAFGPYLTDKYKTPWGSAVNFDDAYCDGVRHFFIENVLMWFRDFHIDGLRIDAVHAIKDFSPVHLLKEMKMHVDVLMKQTGKKHYFIVESDLNDPKYATPIKNGGYGMDAQWTDDFHHALRRAAGEKPKGYYADFNGVSHLAKSYNAGFVFDGIYSEHRKKTFGHPATELAGHQFVVCSQNHDQVGNRMLGERAGTLYSFEMQKLLAASVFVSPFMPMLFMGEEFGELQPFQYFVSHSDPTLAEAVRAGRKAEFEAFHLEGDVPDPMDVKTFELSRLNWTLLTKEPHLSLIDFYKRLIFLRKNHPVLKRTDRTCIKAKAFESDHTILIRRWHGKQEVLCLLNFDDQPQTIVVPDSSLFWNKILDSSEFKWKGTSQNDAEKIVGGAQVTVLPESILILDNNN